MKSVSSSFHLSVTLTTFADARIRSVSSLVALAEPCNPRRLLSRTLVVTGRANPALLLANQLGRAHYVSPVCNGIPGDSLVLVLGEMAGARVKVGVCPATVEPRRCHRRHHCAGTSEARGLEGGEGPPMYRGRGGGGLTWRRIRGKGRGVKGSGGERRESSCVCTVAPNGDVGLFGLLKHAGTQSSYVQIQSLKGLARSLQRVSKGV